MPTCARSTLKRDKLAGFPGLPISRENDLISGQLPHGNVPLLRRLAVGDSFLEIQ